MEDVLKVILTYVAYVMLTIAINFNRKEDSKIKLFSFNWYVQFLLILIAVTILKTF